MKIDINKLHLLKAKVSSSVFYFCIVKINKTQQYRISNTNGHSKGKKQQNDQRCNMLARMKPKDEGISRHGRITRQVCCLFSTMRLTDLLAYLTFSFLAGLWYYCDVIALPYRFIVAYRLELLSMCAGRSGYDVRSWAGCGICWSGLKKKLRASLWFYQLSILSPPIVDAKHSSGIDVQRVTCWLMSESFKYSQIILTSYLSNQFNRWSLLSFKCSTVFIRWNLMCSIHLVTKLM